MAIMFEEVTDPTVAEVIKSRRDLQLTIGELLGVFERRYGVRVQYVALLHEAERTTPAVTIKVAL